MAVRARDNPFAVDCVLKVRYRLRDGTWPDFLDRWAANNYRGAIVGPEGSGKTTLLEDFGDWLEALGAGLPTSPKRPTEGLPISQSTHAIPTPDNLPLPAPTHVKWIRLSEDFPHWGPGFLRRFTAELEPTDVILLDGAEQLSRWTFRRFVRRTRHAAGLLITTHRPGLLRTVLECRTSRRLLHEIVEQLIGPEAAEAQRPTIDRLFDEHNGNLRNALRAMYDLFADGAG